MKRPLTALLTGGDWRSNRQANNTTRKEQGCRLMKNETAPHPTIEAFCYCCYKACVLKRYGYYICQSRRRRVAMLK
jgi:hypothetical protein